MDYMEKFAGLDEAKEAVMDLTIAMDEYNDQTAVAAALMFAYTMIKGGPVTDDELTFVAEEMSSWMAAVTAERKH